MQVMFKNQHSAWLHSVYKYFYSLQSNFIFFFFFFNISWPKSSSKRKTHNKARLSMANDAFVFHLRKALFPETVCPAHLPVPARCLPCFPQGGPTLADCRTTQRSCLHWCGKQNAARKITWILPGPPTWSPDPLQESHVVISASSPDLWEMSVGRCESNWFQSCSRFSSFISSWMRVCQHKLDSVCLLIQQREAK